MPLIHRRMIAHDAREDLRQHQGIVPGIEVARRDVRSGGSLDQTLEAGAFSG